MKNFVLPIIGVPGAGGGDTSALEEKIDKVKDTLTKSDANIRESLKKQKDALESEISALKDELASFDKIKWQFTTPLILLNVGDAATVTFHSPNAEARTVEYAVVSDFTDGGAEEYNFGTVKYTNSQLPANGKCSLDIPKGSALFLKSNSTERWGWTEDASFVFSGGDFHAQGKLIALQGGKEKEFPDPYCLNYVFRDCVALTDASHLVMPEIPCDCNGMFRGCTNLVKAPGALYAISDSSEYAKGCYEEMFMDCTSLEKAPDLLSKKLPGAFERTYNGMFRNCSKLNYVKAMFTDIPSGTGNLTFGQWLSGVAATGTFVKSKDATWADDDATVGIPSGWTIEKV